MNRNITKEEMAFIENEISRTLEEHEIAEKIRILLNKRIGIDTNEFDLFTDDRSNIYVRHVGDVRMCSDKVLSKLVDAYNALRYGKAIKKKKKKGKTND